MAETSAPAAITARDRAVAATAASASGATLVSLEKLGYQFEQTTTRVRITLSLPGPDPLRLDSCSFAPTSLQLRVSAGSSVRGFFDVARLYAPCDPDLCTARLRKGVRVVLDIAKAEVGVEWPRVRAT